MSRLRLEQTQSLQMQQEMRQILRMEQSNLLEMPESEFQRFITEIEQSRLFNRLYRQEKLVRYRRFPRTDISSSFYQLNEETVADRGSFDVDSLLANKEYIVRLIQKIGRDKFKQYFLLPESGMTPDEIADECDLDVAQVGKINRLIDEFSIMSEFYHPSAVSSGAIHYSKVATIEKDKEGFFIGYLSPSAARGQYVIDYEKFEQAKKTSAFSQAEVSEARQLFKKLELINSRKDILTQITQAIVDKQALYLESSDLKALLPFSQKELAKKLGIAPSSISRTISGRSVETPWGAEVPLKRFFPGPKIFKKELLRQLLETEKDIASDNEIRNRLQERFGVAMSRRAVSNLRSELRFSPGRGKRRARQIKETV
jgi:DNA-directed RNA polymerase specialized sigma54-like protein